MFRCCVCNRTNKREDSNDEDEVVEDDQDTSESSEEVLANNSNDELQESTNVSPIRKVVPSPIPEASPSPIREASPSPLSSPIREATPSPIREATPSPIREATPSPIREVSPPPLPEGLPSAIQQEIISSIDAEQNGTVENTEDELVEMLRKNDEVITNGEEIPVQVIKKPTSPIYATIEKNRPVIVRSADNSTTNEDASSSSPSTSSPSSGMSCMSQNRDRITNINDVNEEDEKIQEPLSPPISNIEENQEEGNISLFLINGACKNTVKNNIYDVVGYIERTIIDGPDDEGDDSVFESFPVPEVKDICSSPSQETPPPVPPIPRWLSEEEEEDDEEIRGGENVNGKYGGMQEPPVTPVARDELALRRYRFFSELLDAAKGTNSHRVRFDPLGPLVHPGCEVNDREDHLEDLVTRLENVTARLEKVPTQPKSPQTQETAVQTSTPSPKRSSSSSTSSTPTKTDSTKKTSVHSPSPPQSLVSTPEKKTVLNSSNEMASINGFMDILSGPVREYLNLSQKIGSEVAEHSKLVEQAFEIQLKFLVAASGRPAPTNKNEQQSLLEPTSKQIQKIQEVREKNRGSSFFNHLSAISESIPALGWVAVSPTPAPYIKEMNDAGQFYTNRVLKEWKEKDKTHVEWCKAWVQTLTELQQYVRQNHTTGLVWAKTGSVPAPPSVTGVPPPPPPTMMPIGDVAPPMNDDRNALFAEINRGQDITKTLKKVTSEMQTHKNPSLRTGPAPFKATPVNNSCGPRKTVPPANAPIDKPPVFTKDGKKWIIENHKGNRDLVVDQTEMNNVVYMYRCQDCTLTVSGKINSIVMDSCRKSSIVLDSVVSSIEFVNCQRVQTQVLGKVPTISIDTTDGCQVYLSSTSLGVELITSKSSEMNVMVPQSSGDYIEYPVPEQFKTTICPKGLNTVAVDSLG